MFKEFKNTLLKQTTNKVMKNLEGEKGTLTFYDDKKCCLHFLLISKR